MGYGSTSSSSSPPEQCDTQPARHQRHAANRRRLSRSGLVRVHLGVDRPREQRRPDCEQAGGEAQAELVLRRDQGGQREQGEGVQLLVLVRRVCEVGVSEGRRQNEIWLNARWSNVRWLNARWVHAR